MTGSRLLTRPTRSPQAEIRQLILALLSMQALAATVGSLLAVGSAWILIDPPANTRPRLFTLADLISGAVMAALALWQVVVGYGRLEAWLLSEMDAE